jgi:hypothetical protein
MARLTDERGLALAVFALRCIRMGRNDDVPAADVMLAADRLGLLSQGDAERPADWLLEAAGQHTLTNEDAGD